MARLPYGDQVNLVRQKIQAAGGRITHRALVEQLTQDGNASVAVSLINMSQNGDIQPRVAAGGGDAAELTYSLPAGTTPPAPGGGV